MKYVFFSARWPAFLGFAGLFVLMSCGSERPPSRAVQAFAQADQTQMDTEDIVTLMMVAEKLPDQQSSASQLEERKLSLMPLFEGAEVDEALVVDQIGLSLDSDTDVREATDLRVYDTPIKNQGSRPWCTSFATIAAVENLGRRFFGTSMDLSEIHHFRSYGVYQTSPSLEAGRTRGFIDESLWPYYGQKQAGADGKVRAKLSASRKIKLTLSDVVASIRAGEPVVINLDVNGSFMNPKSGGIIMPGGAKQGGHAIVLTGVVVDSRVGGGGYFIIKNSWGSSWGNRGYGYIPFSYCSYSYCYAWSIADIAVFDDQGKLRDKSPRVVPAPTPDVTPAPQPQPAPTPAPRPAPVPDLIVDGITRDSFRLKSATKDYRGLLGAHFFVLDIAGDKRALEAVQSVIYQVDGYRDFSATTGAKDGLQVLPIDFQSRAYKIWSWQKLSADARIRLKDGRVIDIGTTVIDL